jgi:hypothetical protein
VGKEVRLRACPESREARDRRDEADGSLPPFMRGESKGSLSQFALTPSLSWSPEREGQTGNFSQRKRHMETREAILYFQYSEKMKSGLIIGVNLMAQMASLKEDELSGGKKVLVWYLEGLLRETRVAESVLGAGHFGELEQKVMEVIGRLQLSMFQEAEGSFSEAISLATTSCQRSMSFLAGKGLV